MRASASHSARIKSSRDCQRLPISRAFSASTLPLRVSAREWPTLYRASLLCRALLRRSSRHRRMIHRLQRKICKMAFFRANPKKKAGKRRIWSNYGRIARRPRTSWSLSIHRKTEPKKSINWWRGRSSTQCTSTPRFRRVLPSNGCQRRSLQVQALTNNGSGLACARQHLQSRSGRQAARGDQATAGSGLRACRSHRGSPLSQQLEYRSRFCQQE